LLEVICYPNSRIRVARPKVPEMGTYQFGPPPGVSTCYPGFTLSLQEDFHPLVAHVIPVEFGWMIESDVRWGFLGDHDVQHMAAHGSVVVSDDWSQDQVAGSPFTTVWGNDVVQTFMNPATSYTAASGWQVFADGQPVVSSIIFNLEKAVWVYYIPGVQWRWIEPITGIETVVRTRPSAKWVGLSLDFATMSVLATPPRSAVYDETTQKLSFGMTEGNVEMGALLENPAWDFSPTIPVELSEVHEVGENVVDRAQYVVGQLSSGELVRRIQALFDAAPPEFDSAELGRDMLRNWKVVKSNIVVSLTDLVRFRETMGQWSSLRDTMKALWSVRFQKSTPLWQQALKSYRGILQLGANSWLAIRFGIMPTADDMELFFEGCASVLTEGKKPPVRAHARRFSEEVGLFDVPIRTRHTLTVECARIPDGPLKELWVEMRRAIKWGTIPTCEALVDVLPWSFLVDWLLVRLSKGFSRIDEYIEREYYPISHSITGRKRTWSPPLDKLLAPTKGLSGSVEFSLYTRFCAAEIPLPPIPVEIADYSHTHVAELGALLVQMVRKL